MLKKIASVATICALLGVGGYFALDKIKTHKFTPEKKEIEQLPEKPIAETNSEEQNTQEQKNTEKQKYQVLELNNVLFEILVKHPNGIDELSLRKQLDALEKDHLRPNPAEENSNLLSIIKSDFNRENYQDSMIFWSGVWNENKTKYNEESELFHCTQIMLRTLNRPYIMAYQIIPKEFANEQHISTLSNDTQIPVLLIFDDGFNGQSDELHEGNTLKENLSYSCFDLPYFDGEVVFDKTKTNENAKSLAELIIATIENGPTRVADDCVRKLFNKQY